MKYRLRFQNKDGSAAQARIVEAIDKRHAEEIGRSIALGYGIIFRLAQIGEQEYSKYQYRNLPCVTKDGEKMQYAVSGVDTETKSVGVLEWCRSEKDAIEIIALMNAEHGRFLGLSIERSKS